MLEVENPHNRATRHKVFSPADTNNAGYATIVASTTMVALLALFLAVAGIGLNICLKHKAQSLADLTSLAAGHYFYYEPNTVCGIAKDFLNESSRGTTVRLLHCSVDGVNVSVTVVATFATPMITLVQTRSAVAGPITS